MFTSKTKREITLGGKVWFISPLNDAAHDNLNDWTRRKVFEAQAQLINQLADGPSKDRALDSALEKAGSITFMSAHGAKLAGTVEGLLRIIWEGIAPNHPQTSFEEFCRLEFRTEELEQGRLAFEELSVAPLEKKAGKQSRGKPRPKKRPKKRK